MYSGIHPRLVWIPPCHLRLGLDPNQHVLVGPNHAGKPRAGCISRGAVTWHHVNTAHYIVHHMSKRTINLVDDTSDSEPNARRQRLNEDEDEMDVGGNDSSEEFTVDAEEPPQPPRYFDHPRQREPWQVRRDDARERRRRDANRNPPGPVDFIDQNRNPAVRAARAINAGPPLANYIQNALRRQADDRAPVPFVPLAGRAGQLQRLHHTYPPERTNAPYGFITTTSSSTPDAPNGLRENLEKSALQDEVVLTSFLIFGFFYDAGFPPEIIQLLCQWTVTIYEAVQAIYFAYPHGPVFRPQLSSGNYDTLYTYQPPIYVVDPSHGYLPYSVYPGCNDQFDFDTHPSLRNVGFIDFIERVFENVMILCKVKRELEVASGEWFKAVAAMVSHNFPGCFYYVTPMVMESYGSSARTPIPVVTFSLCDGNGKQVQGFEGFGLNFPPVYSAFITVVNDFTEKHMAKRVLPGVESLELPHVVGKRVSGVISAPADIDKLTEDMRNLCMSEQYRVRVLPEIPHRLVFKVNDKGGELSKFTFCVKNKD